MPLPAGMQQTPTKINLHASLYARLKMQKQPSRSANTVHETFEVIVMWVESRTR